MLDGLSFDVQKDLLIKGWMSHDARWFMAVAGHFGMEVANRLNQAVCRELGRTEMKRFMKTLDLIPPKDIDEYLNLKKAAMSLYGHGLAEYDIKTLDHRSYEIHLKNVSPMNDQCIKACPVGAVGGDGNVDAMKCARENMKLGLPGVMQFLKGWVTASNEERFSMLRSPTFWEIWQNLTTGIFYYCFECLNACPVGKRRHEKRTLM